MPILQGVTDDIVEMERTQAYRDEAEGRRAEFRLTRVAQLNLSVRVKK
jgi:hypothetical protein